MEVIRPSLKRYNYITTIARELNRTTTSIKKVCRKLEINVLYIEYNHRFYIATKDIERIKEYFKNPLKGCIDAQSNICSQKTENEYN